MPKTKRGPALFDLLARGAERAAPEILKVPRWWARKQSPLRGARAEPELADSSVEVGSEPGTEAAPVVKGAPLAELDGNLIRLSFTSAGAAMAVFVVAIAVIGAFAWGRHSGDQRGFRRGYETGRDSYTSAGTSEVDMARGQPPATHVVSGLLEGSKETPARPAGREAAPKPQRESLPRGASVSDVAAPVGADRAEAQRAKWTRGHTYVVVQEFSAGRDDDARRAQDFLAQNGVGAEVVRRGNGTLQLIATEGYDRGSPAGRERADEFLKKVQGLGAKYFSAGGGYKMQGYFKTLKGDTW